MLFEGTLVVISWSQVTYNCSSQSSIWLTLGAVKLALLWLKQRKSTWWAYLLHCAPIPPLSSANHTAGWGLHQWEHKPWLVFSIAVTGLTGLKPTWVYGHRWRCNPGPWLALQAVWVTCRKLNPIKSGLMQAVDRELLKWMPEKLVFLPFSFGSSSWFPDFFVFCFFLSQVHCTGRLCLFSIPWQNIFVNYSADSSIYLEAFFPPVLCVRFFFYPPTL